MSLRSYFSLMLMAGPRMTSLLVLVYFGAAPLILLASAIGFLLLVPKSISLPILDYVRAVIAR